MTAEFAKKKLAVKKSTVKPSVWRNKFVISGLIAIALMLLLAAVFFFNSHRKTPLSTTLLSPALSNVSTWIAERKGHLQAKWDTSKNKLSGRNHHLLHKEVSRPEIHFEFYTALPNMQPVTTTNRTDSLSINPTLTLPVKNKLVIAKTQIGSADELEQELSAQIKHGNHQ